MVAMTDMSEAQLCPLWSRLSIKSQLFELVTLTDFGTHLSRSDSDQLYDLGRAIYDGLLLSLLSLPAN